MLVYQRVSFLAFFPHIPHVPIFGWHHLAASIVFSVSKFSNYNWSVGFNPLHVVPEIIIPFLATSSQSTINFLPTITGWWYTYPSEKYISQLGLWHSQNMESHSKFHGSSHHQPDQLPTINFQPNCYSKCYSVAAHSLMACRFEGAMMWCENMARRPSVTGPPARRPCHSGAGIGESWNNFRHGEKWLIDDFPH